MATNFNIVKKQKHDEDEEDLLDEEEIEEEESAKKSMDSSVKKRMLLFMGVIFIGFILLMLILYLVSIFFHRSYSYDDIELVLKDAAVAYFKDYADYLPVVDGDVVEVDSSNLVAAGKMKDLSEYTKEGILCTGTVQVEKSGSDYLYSPYLNCGDDYTTIELAKKIINEDGNVVTSGYGLYSMNGSYIYRGEDVNNYVQLGKYAWRIVKITSDENVVLIHDKGGLYNPQPWDDRYNESASYASGFNNYGSSRIKEYLEKIYKNPVDDEVLLEKEDLSKLVSFNLCIGKRSPISEGNSNQEECAEVLPDQRYGLLTVSDYMAASVDASCKNATSKSCVNYNYLSKVKNWWLATGNKDDNISAFKVNTDGVIVSDTAANYGNVRPIIYLNKKVLYKSGTGTLDDPYIVK